MYRLVSTRNRQQADCRHHHHHQTAMVQNWHLLRTQYHKLWCTNSSRLRHNCWALATSLQRAAGGEVSSFSIDPHSTNHNDRNASKSRALEIRPRCPAYHWRFLVGGPFKKITFEKLKFELRYWNTWSSTEPGQFQLILFLLRLHTV